MNRELDHAILFGHVNLEISVVLILQKPTTRVRVKELGLRRELKRTVFR